jgi:uncharacterized protein YfbU (UPF0304 family)
LATLIAKLERNKNMEQWVEMDDAEKLIAVKAHSLGKNLLEHERSRYDHVDAMTERGQRLSWVCR